MTVSLAIPKMIRSAIARGEQRICTQEECLGVWSTVWCAKCQAPRCDEHAEDGACATCGSPVVSFAAITETERQTENRYESNYEVEVR